jgi:hypothetical protein
MMTMVTKLATRYEGNPTVESALYATFHAMKRRNEKNDRRDYKRK